MLKEFLNKIKPKSDLLYNYSVGWVEDFKEGLAWFNIKDSNNDIFCGFINKKMEVVVSPIYLKVKGFGDGLASFWDGLSWGFINRKGNVSIRPQFYDVGEGFTEGLCPVRKNNEGNYGYINRKGIYELSPIYQLAWNFKCGMALVVIDNQFYFINRKGKIITEALHKYYGV